MNQQLQASNRDLEAFSYSVSHDLKGPLRLIRGFSEILLEEYGPKLDSESRQYVDTIQTSVIKITALTSRTEVT